ncbi:IS701 family transposase [Salinactinospora qingdaonensis]|uniref:Transposase n=1 Tax=Salinactinospora qingdaonensis TaxID=702744 RepID=A0ABP7FNQ8_9ACTN
MVLTASQSDAREAVLTDMSASLFASLSRADQRRRGLAYLRGLLSVEGRKSISNIASGLGPGAEQSLHHFVSNSTWCWNPMRDALACYVSERFPPRAWVVRPTLIPKAGRNFVGVERHIHPETGTAVNAQRAVGVWSTHESMSVPVHWRLHLPPAWLRDEERRRQALIPDEAVEETMGDCVTAAVLARADREGRRVPVVADARGQDAASMIRRLRARGLPVVVRIEGSMEVEPLVDRFPGPCPAHRLMAAARHLRRVVPLRTAATGVSHQSPLVVAEVSVRLPSRRHRTSDMEGMLLLAVEDVAGSGPTELWLADLAKSSVADVVSLTRLMQQVDYGATIADRLGIRDFSGRSFTGWHRHATLVSAAHAVEALAGTSPSMARSA